jgi:FkbM family methyltransferase
LSLKVNKKKIFRKITMVDIGCRYGILPIFKKFIDKVDFYLFDTDKIEINRLKNKYKKFKNIRLFSEFLGKEDKKIKINISAHKGFISLYKMNKSSFWFSKIRKNQDKIIGHKIVNQKNTLELFKSKKINEIDILKIDTEGHDLEILNSLDQKFKDIKCIMVEGLLDSQYIKAPSFGTIYDFLIKKNFYLAKGVLENQKLNNIETKDLGVPVALESIYLNKSYFSLVEKKNFNTKTIEILFLLELYDIMFEILIYNPKLLSKKSNFYNEIKFYIGHILNKRSKEIDFSFTKASSVYQKIFKEKLPIMSDFYENNFFNPK